MSAEDLSEANMEKNTDETVELYGVFYGSTLVFGGCYMNDHIANGEAA